MPVVMAVCVAWVLAATQLAGCGSASRAPVDSDYAESYRTGRYADSYDAASAAYLTSGGKSKDDAALIAGLSAQAMNRNEDAERWLNLVVRTSDRGISGRAGAALGLIAQERKQHAEAARLLSDAGDKLGGDEGARAYMYAGDSYRALGKSDEAQSMYRRADSAADRDAHLRGMIATRLTGGGPKPEEVGRPGAAVVASPPRPAATGKLLTSNAATGSYTLQVGAFSTKQRADKQAAGTKVRAARLGLGVPRIVTTTDKAGKQLYAVRIGRFPTLDSANNARRSFGSDARVINAPGD